MSNTTYSIVQVRDMYPPDLECGGSPRIVEDKDNQECAGLSLVDAKTMVARLDNETYYASHNEAGRPMYYILEDRDADYYTSGRDGDGGNYSWLGWEDACQSPRHGEACGECQGCIKLMTAEDISGVERAAINNNH